MVMTVFFWREDSSMQRQFRQLERQEISGLWSIDRSELIGGLYRLEEGALVLEKASIKMSGWPADEIDRDTAILLDCFDHGGFLLGAFDHARLVAACVLDCRFMGASTDQLQLKFLHVSQALRGEGLGRELFDRAAQRAKILGARKLYISATPSENTIRFYQTMGCTLTDELDADLFALEPQDIHMKFVLP